MLFFFGIPVEHLKGKVYTSKKRGKKIQNNKIQLNSQAGRVPSTAAMLF